MCLVPSIKTGFGSPRVVVANSSCKPRQTSSGAMPQGSSGEWHTGEVVSLCESYGFIRKDGARPDIFMHYDDVEGFEPQIGDRVSFELAADARFPDRQKAVAVEYSAPAPAPKTPAAPESSPSEHRAELWCCPISMEIMRDPVLAADGFTYERNAIADWLSRGKTKTGAVLPHGSLIPNLAAKAMISDFLDEARRHQAALDASMADEVKGAP